MKSGLQMLLLKPGGATLASILATGILLCSCQGEDGRGLEAPDKDPLHQDTEAPLSLPDSDLPVEQLNAMAVEHTRNLLNHSQGASLNLAGDSGAIPANPSAEASIKHLASESDLVFVGTTTDVKYTLSLPIKGTKNRLPLTYITFKIEKILQGSYAGSSIVVRQMGGWAEDNTFMSSSVSSVYVPGDRDVIFLKKNGYYHFPISNEGRLRIVDDKIYSTKSEIKYFNSKNDLVSGPYQEVKSIIERSLGRGDYKLVQLTVEDPSASRNDGSTVNSEILPKAKLVGNPPTQATLSQLVQALSQPISLAGQSAEKVAPISLSPDDPVNLDGINVSSAPNSQK